MDGEGIDNSPIYVVQQLNIFIVLLPPDCRMISLRIKVNCSTCGKKVDKLETRQLDSQKHECFGCFKAQRPRHPDQTASLLRYNLYCERCRYKFTSARRICPYCNESDYLDVSGPSADELLGSV